MSAARTEQINIYRDQGYEVVQITVSKGQFKDEEGQKIPHSNRPSALMRNPETGSGVLIFHTGETIPVIL